MKTLVIIFLFPIQLFAQDITGLWTGFIHTTEKDLAYELAISETDGKLSGYSHTTFTVNGTSEIGIKAVTIKNKNGNVSIEDEALLYNDFSEAPAKGVRQFDFLKLVVEDTVMMLNGTFKTNKTKVYRSVNGSIKLRKTDTSKKTKIIPRLNDLNLLNTLSFLQPKVKENEDIVTVLPVQEKTNSVQPMARRIDSVILANVLPSSPKPKAKQSALQLPPVIPEKPQVIVAAKPKQIAVAQAPIIIKKPTPFPAVKEKAKPVVVVSKPVQEKKEPAVVTVKPASIPVTQLPQPQIKTTSTIVSAAEITKRKTETIQSINFKSDSLLITLYDNGEVDGDTVSVVLNGRVILANQGLTTNAITKTIYITPDIGDSLQLVMYAENLGSIPPNTGLLILQDGNDRYEIRFAGDYQKNSAVILKRRN